MVGMELAGIVKWQMNMYNNVYFELWIMKFIRTYEFVDIFLSLSFFLSDFIFFCGFRFRVLGAAFQSIFAWFHLKEVISKTKIAFDFLSISGFKELDNNYYCRFDHCERKTRFLIWDKSGRNSRKISQVIGCVVCSVQYYMQSM